MSINTSTSNCLFFKDIPYVAPNLSYPTQLISLCKVSFLPACLLASWMVIVRCDSFSMLMLSFPIMDELI